MTSERPPTAHLPLDRSPSLWYFDCSLSGNNSVVECDLAKVEVAGSNPVSRSNLRSRLITRDVNFGQQAMRRLSAVTLAEADERSVFPLLTAP